MKRSLSIILALLIIISIPAGVSAAKPGGGGGETFAGVITITPAAQTINLNESITLTATWTANLGINRSEWSVDGIAQGAATMKPDKLSGTSSFLYKGLTQGNHTISFRIWNVKFVGKRDTAKSVTVTVNAPQPPATLYYVSLGDSIATGTTTPLTNPTTPYVDQFQSYLAASNPGDTIVRNAFETDGYRTNDLLASLINDAAVRTAVARADYITVSIGGNNLMQACKANNLTGYDFHAPDLAILAQGYADFAVQWELVMAAIRNLNQDAVVLTMTLYNPYNTSDSSMHNLVDSYFSRFDGSGMNDIIADMAASYSYKVADAFTAFNAYSGGNMGLITMMYESFTLIRNPHPNQTGQNILFNLHKAIYDNLP
ncbi:MAG: GDSL-type esterase/lipase family protein [Saccharofermentanales bacterium]